MLLIHRLSYGPALTRNTKERASVLLFLAFSVLVANPKKLLNTVANPARGLLQEGKEKKIKSLAAYPPPILLVRRK